jgi:hypothetical protein
MKVLRASVFLSLVALSAASAWGQLGLYGSPEPLQLLPVPSAPTAYAGQAVSYGMSTSPPTPGPVISPLDQPLPQPLPPRSPMSPALPYGGAQLTSQPGTPVPGPSMVNDASVQPADAGTAGCAGCIGTDGPQAGYISSRMGCGECGERCCPWYASVSALVMSRDRANNLWTTFNSADETQQISTSHDYGWRWGGELTLGRRFCCNCVPWSLEATFWALDTFEVATAPAETVPLYSTPLDMSRLTIPGHVGLSAEDWFGDSPQHRVWRASEFEDVEVNLVRNQFLGCQCQPWNVDWSLGVRYFRFRDHLVFGAEHGPGADAGQWIYLDDEVSNNLIGLQMGFNAEYRFASRWRFFVTPKFGVYDNCMNIDYTVHTSDGTVATQTSYPDRQYPVQASHSGFSFLTQVDVGLGWQITPCWEAKAGYRVLAATGMALSENQVPQYGNDTPVIADIDRNGNLILHGAFFGLTYCF